MAVDALSLCLPRAQTKAPASDARNTAAGAALSSQPAAPTVIDCRGRWRPTRKKVCPVAPSSCTGKLTTDWHDGSTLFLKNIALRTVSLRTIPAGCQGKCLEPTAARRTDSQGAPGVEISWEAGRNVRALPSVVGRWVVVGRRGTCVIHVTRQLRAAGEVTERSKVHAC